MKYAIPLFLTCQIALLTCSANASTASDELLGYWYTEDDDSIVQVTKSNSNFTGEILWLKEPRFEKGDKNAGKLKFDRLNPKKKMRKKPIIGLNVLAGFTYNSKKNEWSGGTIYDPEKGKTYKCEIKFEKDAKAEGGKRLYVRGYLGIPTFGRTTYWYRVPQKHLKKYKLDTPKEEE
jgi:uncharacterized protein (DUF2147 family)